LTAVASSLSAVKALYFNPYYDIVTGELDKEMESLRLWEQSYPRDWTPYNTLGTITLCSDNSTSVAQFQEALRLQPAHPFPYLNLAGTYLALNRYDEAKTILEKAVSQKVDNTTFIGSSIRLRESRRFHCNAASRQMGNDGRMKSS